MKCLDKLSIRELRAATCKPPTLSLSVSSQLDVMLAPKCARDHNSSLIFLQIILCINVRSSGFYIWSVQHREHDCGHQACTLAADECTKRAARGDASEGRLLPRSLQTRPNLPTTLPHSTARCLQCNEREETVKHFLLVCPSYAQQRAALCQEAGTHNPMTQTNNSK
jgi:hypothetical protein